MIGLRLRARFFVDFFVAREREKVSRDEKKEQISMRNVLRARLITNPEKILAILGK